MTHLFLLLFILPVGPASGVIHSLEYLVVSIYGNYSYVPEYSVIGFVDGTPHEYYDSNIRRLVPKIDWMDKAGADHWESRTHEFNGIYQTYKADVYSARFRLNLTKTIVTDIYTTQRSIGCEWNSETGTAEGHEKIGRDGDNFLELNMDDFSWNAYNSEAFKIKRDWDSDPESNVLTARLLTERCTERLKIYLGYRNSSITKKIPPAVSVFQRSSSSPATCHATGFSPSWVMMYWMRDGERVNEGAEVGETLPNMDGTFQIRSTLKLSYQLLKKHRFACVVYHDSMNKVMVIPYEFETPVALIVGITVAVVLVAVLVTGLLLWKKKYRHAGFARARTDDEDLRTGPVQESFL